MLIAHYAPALLAAPLRRAPSLGALFVAASLVDIAWFLLSLAGVEHYAVEPLYTVMSPFWLYDTPYSHSLLGTLGLAAGFAVAWRLAGGSKQAAWIGAGVVAVHLPIDLVFHAPDLTLAGGGRRLGWGLWNHPYAAMPLILLATFVALTRYADRTRPRDARGTATLALLALALAGFQLADWLGPRAREAYDPAPAATAIAGLATITVVVVLGWWTGMTREACPPPRPLAPSGATGTGERT